MARGRGKLCTVFRLSHAIEALVRERQLLSGSEVQAADDFRLAMHQCVKRDVEPEHFQPWTDLHQVLDEEAFGAADVEHSVSRLEVEVLDDVLGDRNPATVIFIAAVTVLARAVEIHLAILFGHSDHSRIFGLSPLLNIALGLGQPRQQIHFGHVELLHLVLAAVNYQREAVRT